MTEPGHNINGQLKSVVERIENLNAQIKELTDDRAEIFKEAGGNGFDVKVLRQLVSIRKQDKSKRDEAQAILESYMASLGMV
jgi:uncharacterized protein (UPF0335 family)